MTDFIAILFKSSLASAVLYGIYFLILRNLSFFAINRLLLNSIIPISFILVLFPIEAPYPTMLTTYLPNEMGLSVSEGNSSQIVVTSQHSDFQIWNILYAVGAFLSAILLILKLKRLRNLLKLPHTKAGKLKLITIENVPTSSFLNYIFINPCDNKDGELVLAHEKIHASKLHSIDLMVNHLYKIIFWFNPIVYLGLRFI